MDRNPRSIFDSENCAHRALPSGFVCDGYGCERVPKFMQSLPQISRSMMQPNRIHWTRDQRIRAAFFQQAFRRFSRQQPRTGVFHGGKVRALFHLNRKRGRGMENPDRGKPPCSVELRNYGTKRSGRNPAFFGNARSEAGCFRRYTMQAFKLHGQCFPAQRRVGLAQRRLARAEQQCGKTNSDRAIHPACDGRRFCQVVPGPD